MKQLFTLFLFLFTITGFAQLTPPTELQSYYNGVDFSNTGMTLFNELATKTISKHTNNLSYSEAQEALAIVDLEPSSSTHVLLLYGFSDDTCETNTSNDNDHRTRDKTAFGGGATCEWNREHTYPKSLGNPSLGTSGPGSDAHHLRACDVQRNSNRGSKKFSSGSGNSGDSNGGWYPGDEWKGDVARMMMYMYLRYGSQCLPTNVGIGNSNSVDSNMINLFLEWNAEDPVSQYEINRNNYLGDISNTYAQGNRNPFIDNPYLATAIWGGPTAQNTWGSSSPDTEAPTAPTDLEVTSEGSTSIELNWTASTDNINVTEYQIYVDGNLYMTVNTNSATVTNLSPETTYSFYVIALDNAGNESTPSETITGTTTNTGSVGGECASEDFENIPPDNSSYTDRTWTGNNGQWTATKARTDMSINDRAITIDFRGNSDGETLTSPSIPGGIANLSITTQRFYSGTDGSLDILVNNTVIGSVPYSDTAQTTTIENINIDGNITVVVQDNDSGSARVAIDDLSWTCYSTMDIDDQDFSKLSIYPNPVHGNFITVSTNETLQFKIYNIIGKLVSEGQTVNNNINVSMLSSGVYIVKLSNGKQQITKKIIKE